MVQAVSYFSGFETGDGSEVSTLGAGNSVQNTIFRSGAYALKASGTACQLVTGLSATQTSGRFYFYAPAGTFTSNSFFLEVPSRLQIRFASGSTPKITMSDAGSSLGLTLATGITNMTGDTWHLIEFVYDLAAGGVVQLWADGVLQINTTHTSNVAGTPTTGWNAAGAANPNEKYYDDVLIATGGLTRIGRGACIARQGTTGTPTYNAWTKNGAATAALCWSDTPFSTATNCTANVAATAQTMLVSPFSATQTGHGGEVTYPKDIINACKVGLVGKTAVNGNITIRRRVGGADTDVSVALTTGDTYKQTTLFTDTVANLDAYEIGVVNPLVATLETIEDMWMMIDYVPNGAGISSNLLTMGV